MYLQCKNKINCFQKTGYGSLFYCLGALAQALLVALCMGSLDAQASPTAHHVNKGGWGWLAFGDVRGYIEPCGCDPTADLGGLKRLAVMVERERAYYGSFYLWHLGNLPPVDDAGLYKLPYLVSGLARLKITATLVNELELRYKDQLKKLESLSYVLTNQKKSLDTYHYAEIIQLADTDVFGYYFKPKDQSWVEQVNRSWLKQLTQKFPKSFATKKRKKVLLFSGSDADLSIFLQAKIFDVIITSNQAPLKQIVDDREKQDPSLLKRAPEVYQVPIGGQGVLRGGLLRRQQAPSITELINPHSCTQSSLLAPLDPPSFKQLPCLTPDRNRNMAWTQGVLVTWLDKQYELESLVDPVLRQYEQKAQSLFLATQQSRLNDLKDSPYVGAQACQGCHAKAYQVWQQSAHAQAYDILKQKAKHQDPECVGCHVLGYQDKGGFVSEQATPQFMHVQCENCHGPRKDHIKQPAQFKSTHPVTEQTCRSCHVGGHSPHFNFQKYWSQIKH